MPKESLTVYLTAVDGMSPVLASITDKTKALDKETQTLQQTTSAFTKANQTLLEKQGKLKSEMDSAAKTVKEMQKAYDEYKDELSKSRLDNAIEQHAKLKNELVEVSAQLDYNRRAYKDNIEELRKGGLETQGTSLKSVAEGIFAGQVGQMFASAAGTGLQALFTSEIGVPEASLVSDILSNAIAGGTAGLIAGPTGAAIGAGVGVVSGLISGGTKIYEAKDDVYKDYYGGLYEDAKERSDKTVESGSTLAASREKDQISFSTLFGDKETAKAYLTDLVDMSNRTPFLYDDLTAMSKTLATYGYGADNILPLLETIGDTGAALGMGTSDMTAVAQALGRMKSSDKTTLEYLNILNDRGIGAVGMLAEAKGVSVGEMYSMISKGQIAGGDAVEIITKALKEAYSGSMLEQSQTFSGITSTLEGLTQELENAGGEAYNTLRQSGKSAMVDAYGGELGDAIKEINAVIGENRARKENLQDQYMREVLDAVLNGTQGELWNELAEDQRSKLAEMNTSYTQWKEAYEASGRTDAEAAAQMESLYEQAQSLGQAYFDESELVKTLNDTELEEVEAIREATKGLSKATDATYELTQALSKGRGLAGLGGGDMTPPSATSGNASHRARFAGVDLTTINSHAFGLDRVPYDGYPSLLHEGERVLTAAEAREQDAHPAASPVQITITGNSFTGTPEEMADTLAEILVRRLTQAAIAAAPR